MSSVDRISGVAPDMALSTDERRQVEKIVAAWDDVPTLTREELREKDRRKNPATSALWDDERDGLFFERFDHELPRYGLPGFGERYEDCGARIPHVCSNPECGQEVQIGRTCARSRCPRCGAAWVIKRAPKIVSRIHEAARMKEGTQFKHHGAISFPDEFFVDADDPLEKVYEFGHDLMDAIDMDGVMFYHPWRGSDVEGDRADDRHADDRGEWKNRLFAGRDWQDVRDELEFSPHLHIIGSCEWFPGGDQTEAIYEETGVVIHRITERNGSPVSLGDVHSLARAVTYCLSHVGVDTSGDRNRSAYRKHGSAFHNADLRTLDDAKAAVHDVAPDTLGVPSMHVECRNKVDADDELDHLDDVDGEDPAADADDSDDAPDKRPCRSELTDVDDADRLLDSDTWRAKAPDVVQERVAQLYQEWQDAGGWQGWLAEHGDPDDFPDGTIDGPPD